MYLTRARVSSYALKAPVMLPAGHLTPARHFDLPKAHVPARSHNSYVHLLNNQHIFAQTERVL